MVSHPANFGGYRHYGSRDIDIPTIMVNLRQMRDITYMTVYAWSPTSTIFIFCKTHAMSCLFRKNFPGSAMKFLREWPHASWVRIYEKQVKNFCKSVRKHCREGEKEKKPPKNTAVAKCFTLNTNAITTEKKLKIKMQYKPANTSASTIMTLTIKKIHFNRVTRKHNNSTNWDIKRKTKTARKVLDNETWDFSTTCSEPKTNLNHTMQTFRSLPSFISAYSLK